MMDLSIFDFEVIEKSMKKLTTARPKILLIKPLDK